MTEAEVEDLVLKLNEIEVRVWGGRGEKTIGLRRF
jgi:hypothetical protein